MGRTARHPDAHRGHARPALAGEARQRRPRYRDGTRRRVSLPPARGPPPRAEMRLATRVFLGASLLAAGTAVGLIVAADQILRQRLEDGIAAALEGDARLIALVLPADTSLWPDAARRYGAQVGRRVTLIDSTGRGRGDPAFARASLAPPHTPSTRPHARAALAPGAGSAPRPNRSPNERPPP